MATNINVPSHFEHNFSIACDKFIGAILPDLSKTFDKVNYDILLTKLSMYFTIVSTPCSGLNLI